jgi:hypothetical protein
MENVAGKSSLRSGLDDEEKSAIATYLRDSLDQLLQVKHPVYTESIAEVSPQDDISWIEEDSEEINGASCDQRRTCRRP